MAAKRLARAAEHSEGAATLSSSSSLIHSSPSFFGIQRVSSSNALYPKQPARLLRRSCLYCSPFGQPQPKNIPLAPLVAYISISISIIAGELPASSDASQDAGYKWFFPGIFPLPVTSSSRRLFGCLVVSRYLSVDVCVSLSLAPPSFHLLPPRLVPAAFQHPASSATHTFEPQEPLDCEFPRRRVRAASFLAEEISGLDHAIDFHASPVSVFLCPFPSRPPSFVARLSGSTGNLNSIFRVSIENTST